VRYSLSLSLTLSWAVRSNLGHQRARDAELEGAGKLGVEKEQIGQWEES